jgi:hypothetical protein
MFKNKKILYFLIPITLIIWGIIIYKLFEVKNGGKQLFNNTIYKNQLKNNFDSTILNYVVQANYRDPFYPAKVSSTSIRNVKVKVNFINKEKVKVDTMLTSISYKGMVCSEKSRLAFIQYRNEEKSYNVNDTLYNYRIVNIFRDSLILKKGNKKITIIRSQS